MLKESSSSPSSYSEEERDRQENEHIDAVRKLNIQTKEEGLLWLNERGTEHLAEANKERFTDKLTGILNRRGFDHFTEDMLTVRPAAPGSEKRKYPAPHYESFTMLTMDIDRFKSINDTYGHAVGDEAIKELARFLKENLREGDVLGRFGGDEFVALFPNAAAEDIRKRFAGKTIELDVAQKEGMKKVTITLSGGIKEFKPGEDFDTAYKEADDALYKAKQNGRNGIVIAGETNE